MTKRIGVGIIGVTPGESWAAVAHIPALRVLDEYELRAVSSRHLQSAQSVATAYNIPHVFENHADLVASPAVDLVVVTVRVPAHLQLVEAAINAGKQVYCEWPLGNGLEEAERMAALARERRVHCAVGLQARAAPAIVYVRDLIANGFVGEVLSTTMLGSGMNWAPGMDRRNLYTLDKGNGATLLTIAMGHAMDALCYCLGEFAELNATATLRRHQISFADSGESYPVTAEDQWAISGILQNRALASVHYRGGCTRGRNFLWEINGTEGDLVLSSDFGHAQILQLSLSGAQGQEAMTELVIPEQYYWVPELPDPALNAAQAYARFASDLRHGTHTCPAFDEAVVRHRMIAAIEQAAQSGTRQYLS